jgi:small-conductance mechanosensitive channel
MSAHSLGLLQLRPVVFRYKQDPQGERQYGLIAEQVAKVYPELVARNAAGAVETVRYQELIPMLLNQAQQQQRQLAALKAQYARLQEQLQEQDAALAARLERLEAAAARTATLASR